MIIFNVVGQTLQIVNAVGRLGAHWFTLMDFILCLALPPGFSCFLLIYSFLFTPFTSLTLCFLHLNILPACPSSLRVLGFCPYWGLVAITALLFSSLSLTVITNCCQMWSKHSVLFPFKRSFVCSFNVRGKDFLHVNPVTHWVTKHPCEVGNEMKEKKWITCLSSLVFHLAPFTQLPHMAFNKECQANFVFSVQEE